MLPNFATVTGTIHAEPHYGYTGKGALYCNATVEWVQEMTDKTINHGIPVVIGGPAAAKAKTELQAGQLVKFSGRLSAPSGILKFVATSYEIKPQP